jgi:cell division protein FtsL
MNSISDYIKEQEIYIKNNGSKKFKIKLLIIIIFLFVFSMFGFLHTTHQIFNEIFGSGTVTVSRKQLKQELKHLKKDEAINSKITKEIKELSRNNAK